MSNPEPPPLGARCPIRLDGKQCKFTLPSGQGKAVLVYHLTRDHLMKKSKAENTCLDCGASFHDKGALERHGWMEHPSDFYQEAWARAQRSGRGMLANKDSPYY